jgi:hypothetical protein
MLNQLVPSLQKKSQSEVFQLFLSVSGKNLIKLTIFYAKPTRPLSTKEIKRKKETLSLSLKRNWPAWRLIWEFNNIEMETYVPNLSPPDIYGPDTLEKNPESYITLGSKETYETAL